MHRLQSTSPQGNGDYNNGLLRPGDSKERDVTHASQRTQVLRHLCRLPGPTSQSDSGRPGRSAFQFERKTAGKVTFIAGPVRERGQTRGSNPRYKSEYAGGNDWDNPLTSEFLHEQIQEARL